MNLEQELCLALAPCEPGPAPLALVMAQVSAARSTRRKPLGIVLFGALLAVAAAASLLVVRLMNTPESAPAIVAGTPVQAPATAVPVIDVPGPAIVRAVPAAIAEPAAQEYTAPAVKSFRVRVLPLQNDSTDAAGKAAVDSFHAALLEDLRAVPGLMLTVADAAGTADAPAEYRLTIRGSGPVRGNQFTIYMTAEAVGHFRLPIQLSGDIAPPCAGTGASDCGDPPGMAATFLDLLRNRLFPADTSPPAATAGAGDRYQPQSIRAPQCTDGSAVVAVL